MTYYTTYLLLTLIGLVTGFMLDVVGGGADVVIVPLLLLFHVFKSIRLSIGTSILALMPPITAFAAYKYYKAGNVDVTASIYLATIYALASFAFSDLVLNISENTLRKIQSIFIILVGIFSWFTKP